MTSTRPRRLAIGVDLGGTKIEAVVVDMGHDEPRVLSKARIATERGLGYEHILRRVGDLVGDVAKLAGLRQLPPVGIGMPGSTTHRTPDGRMSQAALVKNSNTTCLNGRAFFSDVRAKLETPLVAFGNDANCFALAEATWGAARDARVTFGAILGTGVGGGIVLRHADERRVWPGAQGIAGEWGHMSLEPVTGPLCYCGRRGCVETLLSGPSLERAYEAETGVSLSLADIASDPVKGHPFLESQMPRFGRALSYVVNLLDPDVVVIGGGVANVDMLYAQGAQHLSQWIFNDECKTRLQKNELGDSAGVLGAALLPSLAGAHLESSRATQS